MLITRISTPNFAAVDTTTLSEWLRIDEGTDRATINLLLASAVDWIEGYTGRVVCAANYTVSVSGCSPRIPLDLFPVNSVASVTANLADGSTGALSAGTDYLADLSSYSPHICVLSPLTGVTGYVVTLNAGYTNPAAVPPGIQHAAAVLVGAGYDSRSGLDPMTLATVNSLLARHRRSFL